MPAEPSPSRTTRRLAYRVPDRLDEAAFTARLRVALSGLDPSVDTLPATDRSTRSASGAPADSMLVWEDAGDEVLVHLDSLIVRLQPQLLVASVDLESDETGRGPVIVRFVLGTSSDMAGLVASTDDVPHGNAALAARWGIVFRDVVWATLIGTVNQHARERGLAPQALVIAKGQLRLRTTTDVPLADRLGSR